MEVDLKIYSNLSKKQYGFKRGSSTIAAVHKLVKKFEFAILNQGMALGTFLDIEGAFDNVSFDAIERALDSKCKFAEVNQWIRSMIHNRQKNLNHWQHHPSGKLSMRLTSHITTNGNSLSRSPK